MKCNMYYTYNINIDYVTGRLALLSSELQILYGLLCCERMFPNFCQFSKEVSWKSPEALRVYLDIIWKYIEGKKPEKITSLTLDNLMELAPDTEDNAKFQSVLTSAALDAVSGPFELLKAIAETNDFVTSVANTIEISFDSVEMYVSSYYRANENNPSTPLKINKSLTAYIDNPLVDIRSCPTDDPWSIITINHPIVHRELTLLLTTLNEIESGKNLSYMKLKYQNNKYGSLCYWNQNHGSFEYR